jgi:hypothetical protein
MLQGSTRKMIEQRGFVELRGRPSLVEALCGDVTDLQSLYQSNISDHAQVQRLEILWDVKIDRAYFDEERIRPGLPNAIRVEGS